MNIKKMTKEELELLSYTDIAYEILKKEKSCKTTVDLFKEIATLLEMSEYEYTSTIGEFYTTLTTDKRFLALSTGEWDLKERNTAKVVIDDDDDFDVELDEIDTNSSEEEKEDEMDIDYDANEDYEDNDLEDLVVVEDDENYDE